ncbi:MAG: hypothetical protein M1821_004892 [Bathelium mastoideum]|nr:MAG: hypothetical protein M1821_004892 [Bathelium mastoideum]
MDPLSVGASIVGLLAAGQQIATILYSFVAKVKDAPSLARTVAAEVTDISAALGQLQAYLIGMASANTAGANFILLEQVFAVLCGCVATFSELEAAIDNLKITPHMAAFDRAIWSVKEPRIVAIVQRLQNHKTSLTLMLAILQCKSQQEAQNSIQQLQDSVNELLRTHQTLAARFSGLEEEGSIIPRNEDGDHATVKSNQTSRPPDSTISPNPVLEAIGFAFEEDLQSSHVYRKAVYQHSQVSLTSSALYSTALSVFSKLTLSRISNVSVYALPVYPVDLYNNRRYIFGEAGAEAAFASNEVDRLPGLEKASTEPQVVTLSNTFPNIEVMPDSRFRLRGRWGRRRKSEKGTITITNVTESRDSVLRRQSL